MRRGPSWPAPRCSSCSAASWPRAWAANSSRASTKAISPCTRCAFPAPVSRQRSQMQQQLEKRIKAIPGGEGGLRQNRHGRDCHRSDAAERGRHLHHAEAARGVAGSEQTQGAARRGDRSRGAQDSRQQLRIHPADSDALQRADRRRAQRRGGQDFRRRHGACWKQTADEIEKLLAGDPRRGRRESWSRSPACRC